MMSATDAAVKTGSLAIICGGGSLPFAVARAAERAGRRVVLFPVRGWADPAAFAAYPHHWLALVQAGRFRKLAGQEGCRDVVFVGTAVRPPFRSLRIDFTTLRILLRIFRGYRGGDDHLLSAIVRIFEDYGFRVLGAHEVAPDILMPAGPVGMLKPSRRDDDDIALALRLLAAVGPFDIGQGAIVADNHVLAIEAAEGTDAMLSRIVELRARHRIATPLGVGVLVKAPKPGQERRVDLPTIGPRTVEEAARAGLAGIAVVAGGALIAEPAAVAAAADKAKIFVFGIEAAP